MYRRAFVRAYVYGVG